jgi:hypothetical protein
MGSVIERLGCSLGRRDTEVDKTLARKLVESKDKAAFKELAANLEHPDQRVRSGCLKVLYEAGYLEPKWLEPYAEQFLDLVAGRNNRMAWGGMIALSAIARKKAKTIWPRIDEVTRAVDSGTVITVVWGVRVLAGVAAADPDYGKKLFPRIMKIIASTIARDVPTHAESALPAVDRSNQAKFLQLLKQREKELSPSQLAKLKRILKALE